MCVMVSGSRAKDHCYSIVISNAAGFSPDCCSISSLSISGGIKSVAERIAVTTILGEKLTRDDCDEMGATLYFAAQASGVALAQTLSMAALRVKRGRRLDK